MVVEEEFEGTSEADALRLAAEAFDVSTDRLDYILVDEGSEGVFGIGARPARIRVSLREISAEEDVPSSSVGAEIVLQEAESLEEEGVKASSISGPAPEKLERALEVSRDLLRLMGLSAEVSGRDEEERIVVVLADAEESQDVSEVFGKTKPPLAPAFQFLLNKVVNRFPEGRKHVLVEAAGGFKARSDRGPGERGKNGDDELDPELVALAQLVAEKAVSTKRVITVHPMRPGDRRAVHQTILKLEGVRTVSAGEGLYRKMHIVPVDGGNEGGRRRRKGPRRSERSGRSES